MLFIINHLYDSGRKLLHIQMWYESDFLLNNDAKIHNFPFRT